MHIIFYVYLNMKTNKVHFVVENLLKIMKDRGLNKVEFATLLGIAESKWNKISNGNQELSISELSNFARKLEMRDIDIYTYPIVYTEENSIQTERISVTFEVSPDKRDMLLKLVTKSEQ